ncbi:MAG: response regulator transcription factor [Bacteroidetes bacterium]|nr:response regulator transcription factor [Bacteroidota bacterium]
MKIPILIAQSNYLVSEGIKTLIFNNSGLLFNSQALNGDDLSLLAETFKSGVIIIDHNDPAFGISIIRKVKLSNPEIGFLSISDKPNRWMLSEALRAGISSYLCRDCGKEEILEAIEATANGEQFFCGKILSDVLRTDDAISHEPEFVSCAGLKISQRESEIIGMVSEGLTNKEIAKKLFLSAHTVTTHRKNIMAKLGVNNTAGLVLFAIRNSIISPNLFSFNTN